MNNFLNTVVRYTIGDFRFLLFCAVAVYLYNPAYGVYALTLWASMVLTRCLFIAIGLTFDLTGLFMANLAVTWFLHLFGVL
jgi:hypothetical protein